MGYRIAVDIDGTICVERDKWWEYHLCEPIPDAIRKINELYDTGHHITYYTSRWEVDRDVTEEWFQKWGVKYDELVMGKFRAQYYIDNAAYRMEEIHGDGDIFGQRSVQRKVEQG